VGSPRHILLAVDGSEASTKAVELIADMAHRLQSKVTVVHVREANALLRLASAAAGMNEPVEDEDVETRREGQDLLDRVRDRLVAAGVETTAELGESVHGAAAAIIVESARRLGADLVVIGSHGRGELASALLGGTAYKVIQRAHVPVLVVR